MGLLMGFMDFFEKVDGNLFLRNFFEKVIEKNKKN